MQKKEETVVLNFENATLQFYEDEWKQTCLVQLFAIRGFLDKLNKMKVELAPNDYQFRLSDK